MGDTLDIVRLQNAIAAERHHLRNARVRMRRVDADADGLSNRLRRTAPEPGGGGEVWEAPAGPTALGIVTVAGPAIVAEKRAAGPPHEAYQCGIGLYRRDIGGRDRR